MKVCWPPCRTRETSSVCSLRKLRLDSGVWLATALSGSIVHHMVKHDAGGLGRTFAALVQPTRPAILSRLGGRDGARTPSGRSTAPPSCWRTDRQLSNRRSSSMTGSSSRRPRTLRVRRDTDRRWRSPPQPDAVPDCGRRSAPNPTRPRRWAACEVGGGIGRAGDVWREPVTAAGIVGMQLAPERP